MRHSEFQLAKLFVCKSFFNGQNIVHALFKVQQHDRNRSVLHWFGFLNAVGNNTVKIFQFFKVCYSLWPSGKVCNTIPVWQTISDREMC